MTRTQIGSIFFLATAAGRFEVSNVMPGSGHVSLREGGPFNIRGRYGMEQYTIEAGGTVDIGDVVLESMEEQQEAMAAASRELLQRREHPDAKLWIAAVEPNGVGETAGFRFGDRIVSVGRSNVEGHAHEIMSSLSGRWRAKGRPVPWVIERDGKRLELEVLVPD
jgi:hypothetical protein